MTKRQTSIRMSSYAQTQLEILRKATGLTQAEIILIALNELYLKHENRIKVMLKINDILSDPTNPNKKLHLKIETQQNNLKHD